MIFINCNSSSKEEYGYDKNASISDKKNGYSSPSLTAPYYKALLNSLKETTLKNDLEFIYTNAEDNPQKQIDDINDMIIQGIDILLLNPKNPKTLLAATKNAEAIGIPVLIIDGSINKSANYVTNTQSNNHINGKFVSKWTL